MDSRLFATRNRISFFVCGCIVSWRTRASCVKLKVKKLFRTFSDHIADCVSVRRTIYVTEDSVKEWMERSE